jgi:hypothetical protein
MLGIKTTTLKGIKMKPVFWAVSGRLTSKPEQRVVITGSDNSNTIISNYLDAEKVMKYFGLEIHNNFTNLKEAEQTIGKE